MRDSYNRYSNEEFAPSRSNSLVNSRSKFLQSWNTDAATVSVLGFGLIYLTVKEPLLIALISLAGLFFYCLSKIIHFIPGLNRLIRSKIRFWHIAAVILALAFSLGLFEMPAGAVFMSGLEEFVTELASQSGAGGGQSVSPEAIKLVFNVIRAVFLILVGVAALFAGMGDRFLPLSEQLRHRQDVS